MDYTFIKSKSGEIVPAIITSNSEVPLHSTVDPVREAERLVSTIPPDTGFIIFLGLGGGFVPQVVLANTDAQVVVIDYGIKELLSSKDYSVLLENRRLTLLADPLNEEIEKIILELYKPALHGGIKTIPLRARVEKDTVIFNSVIKTIEQVIESISGDFSVQAHFGKRWFSNIIRNIALFDSKPRLETSILEKFTLPIQEAAVVAAGPSLDRQISALAEFKSGGGNRLIICCDTALPALINHGIKADAVVSIDCQHISYYHFLGKNNINRIPLFLDIASPPLLSHLSPMPVFFSSGHPLALYVSKHWKPLPHLDTSGGNVTYAAVSFAAALGIKHITLFGADFSYIGSQTYARSTYIYPYFEKKQIRFTPLETLHSVFLYRSPFLPQKESGQKYRETNQLCFYRKKLEEKASAIDAKITVSQGLGAPIDFSHTSRHGNLPPKIASNSFSFFETENVKTNYAPISGLNFLEQYRDKIAALPPLNTPSSKNITENYIDSLSEENRHIFTTLLPLAAYFKRKNPALKISDLIEKTKQFCIDEIEKLL